jgi:hypothetical protein
VKSLRILALVAAAAGALALPATSAGAATLHPTKEFVTPTVTVTTSTGARVHFSVDMIHDHGTSIDIDLYRSTRHYAEDHDWSFGINSTALTYSKGRGTLITGKRLGLYGRLRLTFTKVGQTTKSCRNDDGAATKVTNVKAAVKGIVVFKARSSASSGSKWGVVRKGTTTAKYHFGHQYARYISTTNGRCGMAGSGGPTGNFDCMTGTFWQGPLAGTSSVRLVAGAAQQGFGAQIVGLRFSTLSYPAGAMRLDSVGTDAPDPVVDTTGANPVLTVNTTPGSVASGSATLTATAAATPEPDSPCTDNSTTPGTTKTQSVTDYQTADYANGSTPLTVASMVGSDIRVPNAVGGASFTTYSYA